MLSRTLLGLVLVVGGCCGGPELQVLSFEPRAEVELRRTFVVLGAVLDSPAAWGYATSPELAVAFEAAYRPEITRGRSADRLGSADEAPPLLAKALAAAERGLVALGYTPAVAGDAVDLVCLVGVTGEAGAPTRVGVHLGGELDGRFEPFLIGVAAQLPREDPCEITVEALVAELVEIYPEHEDPQ